MIGIYAYTLVVLPMKGFSAYAGGIALGVIMLPIVARTTEEMISLVPTSLREASLALGVPHVADDRPRSCCAQRAAGS